MEKHWNEFHKKYLFNKTIASVRYMSKGEAKNMNRESRPLTIFFTDGSFFFPSIDDIDNDEINLFSSSKHIQDKFYRLYLHIVLNLRLNY